MGDKWYISSNKKTNKAEEENERILWNSCAEMNFTTRKNDEKFFFCGKSKLAISFSDFIEIWRNENLEAPKMEEKNYSFQFVLKKENFFFKTEKKIILLRIFDKISQTFFTHDKCLDFCSNKKGWTARKRISIPNLFDRDDLKQNFQVQKNYKKIEKKIFGASFDEVPLDVPSFDCFTLEDSSTELQSDLLFVSERIKLYLRIKTVRIDKIVDENIQKLVLFDVSPDCFDLLLKQRPEYSDSEVLLSQKYLLVYNKFNSFFSKIDSLLEKLIKKISENNESSPNFEKNLSNSFNSFGTLKKILFSMYRENKNCREALLCFPNLKQDTTEKWEKQIEKNGY